MLAAEAADAASDAEDEDGPAVVANLAPVPSPEKAFGDDVPFASDLVPSPEAAQKAPPKAASVPFAFRRPSAKASLFGKAEFIDSDDSDDDDAFDAPPPRTEADAGAGAGAGAAGDAARFPAMRVLDGLEAYKNLARAALLRKALS